MSSKYWENPFQFASKSAKILKVFLKTWESKVDTITEAKDLMTMPMDELIGNLQTYELNMKQLTSTKIRKKGEVHCTEIVSK